jgi:hypothetical protein
VSSARGKPGERYRLVGQYNFNSFNPTKKYKIVEKKSVKSILRYEKGLESILKIREG